MNFWFMLLVGQYLTSILLRETGTEYSSCVAHARYILHQLHHGGRAS